MHLHRLFLSGSALQPNAASLRVGPSGMQPRRMRAQPICAAAEADPVPAESTSGNDGGLMERPTRPPPKAPPPPKPQQQQRDYQQRSRGPYNPNYNNNRGPRTDQPSQEGGGGGEQQQYRSRGPGGGNGGGSGAGGQRQWQPRGPGGPGQQQQGGPGPQGQQQQQQQGGGTYQGRRPYNSNYNNNGAGGGGGGGYRGNRPQEGGAPGAEGQQQQGPGQGQGQQSRGPYNPNYNNNRGSYGGGGGNAGGPGGPPRPWQNRPNTGAPGAGGPQAGSGGPGQGNTSNFSRPGGGGGAGGRAPAYGQRRGPGGGSRPGGPGGAGGAKRPGGGKVKIDVGNRRKARQSRKAERDEKTKASAREREDIFEVGPEGMSVMDLAAMLAVPPVDIVKRLFMKGLAVQVNSTLDAETVKLVGTEYDVDVLDKEEAKPEDSARKTHAFIEEGDLEHLVARPPVVTVMGHVDHGKTSLLDFVRKSKVAAGEAGGITQSIGAYTCDVEYGGEMRQVTFLDTPGHEAFSAMRARGARVTDIAIIIVAADDGVRPQTLEAVSHAKAAGVPIVVAINKIDKEGANAERVKQELTEVELIPEEWGGKTPMVTISAKKGQGVDELLETVLLVAELEELQANPTRNAVGTVLEASLDKRAGPVATLLLQNGTLRVGDSLVAGETYGKVRSMRATSGEVTEAGPSIAVQVLGLNAVPTAGDEFEVFESEGRARAAAEAVEDARRLERLSEIAGGGSMVTLSSLASMDDDAPEEQALQRMNIILKADASGSVEAVKSALSALPQDTVVLRYLLAAPGEVTVSDIDLAVASSGMVLSFGVTPTEAVSSQAKRAGVNLSSYSVIYDLVDDVRAVMEGRLRSQEERLSLGWADVKAVFGSGSRKAAGCAVMEGALRKGSTVVVRRKKNVVYEGELTSLRRLKDDVREVPAGTECGVFLEGFKDWEEGDKVEAFELSQKRPKLEEAHATSLQV